MVNGVIAIKGTNQKQAKYYLEVLSTAMKPRGSNGQAIIRKEVIIGNALSIEDNLNCISFDGILNEKSTKPQDVIIAYEKEGTGCFQKLYGSFAFCLWDDKNKVLFAVRDRFGLKPLYYTKINENVIFSSEIKALLALTPCFQPNESLICEYLLSGSYSRTGQTFFQGIYELLPGHYLQITDTNLPEPIVYCDFPTLDFRDYKKDSCADEYNELLNHTINKTLFEKQNAAVSVSGGLDSTVMATLIKKHAKDNLNYDLYSVVCEGANYREAELPYIVDYERFIEDKINYIVIPCPPTWSELETYLLEISEPAPILNYFMSYTISKELQKKDTCTVYTGNGADIFMFGTYDEHMKYLSYLWKRKKLLTFTSESLAYLVKQDYKSFNKRLISFINYRISKTTVNKSYHLMNPDFFKAYFKENSPSSMDTIADILQYNNNFDRIYSSHGIDVIHPFLDQKLVEYTAKLPSSKRIHLGVRKYLMRQVAKGLTPESIRKCKRKFPSTIPLPSWLRAWKNEINELLYSKEFSERGYYNVRFIQTVYDRYLKNELNSIDSDLFANKLWRIINLELWLRQNKELKN